MNDGPRELQELPPDAVEEAAGEAIGPAEEAEGSDERAARYYFFGALAFLLVLMVAVAIVGIASLQALINEEEAARSAWTRVETVLDSRRRLLDDAIRMQDWIEDAPRAVRRYRAVMKVTDTAVSFDHEVAATVRLDAAAAGVVALIGRAAAADTTGGLERIYARLNGLERLRRIEAERFNEAAARYRRRLRRIPTRWLAVVFGFRELPAYALPG